jgi:U4/U6 small nuclear ribonucleoprotein PRP4
MCISGTCCGLQVTNQSSEIADDRPSAACEFAPDGSTLATGAWSGLLKLWSVPDCQKKLTIKAHDDRVTGKNCQLRYCKL